MSRGSALVSILFAFFCGIVIGNITASGGSSGSEEATAAKEGDEGTGAGEVKDDGVERFKVPVTAAQPVKGPADAAVTIVAISDFQCPFCSRVEPTLAQLMTDYKGKVRVVWRNNPLPFHQNAMPAAELAMEAMEQGGSEKFWKAHDKLFANQQALARENLDAYAKELGLDMTKYKAAMDNHTHKAKIEADQAMAAKFDARGTPAFFINGRFLSGAQPIDKFKEIVDDEIKRADKLVKSGVAKNQLYAALTKNALAQKSAAAPDAPAQPRRQPDPKAVYKVPVGSSPAKGPSDALVTIVEFSDFQCPFCSRVEGTVKQITETYGKDVRVVFKQNPLPFHQNAGPAAEASLEARDQGKFWEMHEKLFANQQALEKDKLEGYAKELGLNVAKFKTALETNKHKAEIDADQKLARDLGASGTPSFFINGRSLRGAQPFDAFKTVIDEELAKAKQLVASGTSKSQLYAKITEDGATAPKFIDAPNQPAPSAPAEPDADKIYKIAEAGKAPVKGAGNAKVVIQQFSDFQCPFCSRVEPTVKQIEETYGNKVKIVWRDYPLPFHQDAMPAAEAAKEVFAQGGNEKFWKFHELLFANQRALSRADLEKYAEQVGGINMAKFKAALDSHKHKDAVQADIDAVDKAGARIGTPSFFINGKLLQGAQPFDAFKTAIDAALASK
ncbi:MAG TPA: thioredoxin domain-containing protein [Polyangiales bacterium]|nr:thioredoxin domain-containing protein [Polyangiales bacterium]